MHTPDLNRAQPRERAEPAPGPSAPGRALSTGAARPSGTARANGVGGAPGSGGELFQGWVEGRGWRQAALPLRVGRWARVQAPPATAPAHGDGARGGAGAHGGALQTPGWKPWGSGGEPAGPRVRALLADVLHLTGLRARLGGDDLAPGAGLGSSTADLGATLAALEDAGLIPPASPLAWTRAAVAVEPTNSTLFPRITLLDHREGREVEVLGEVPELAVLLVVPGTRLATRDFNARLPTRVDPVHVQGWREALALLRAGLVGGDLEAVGRAATLSARLRDLALPAPGVARPSVAVLEGLWRGAPAGVRRAILGVIASHSGTAAGFLLDPGTLESSSLDASSPDPVFPDGGPPGPLPPKPGGQASEARSWLDSALRRAGVGAGVGAGVRDGVEANVQAGVEAGVSAGSSRVLLARSHPGGLFPGAAGPLPLRAGGATVPLTDIERG
jgi:hypothetical protein